MWENAAPLPENEPPRQPARCAGSEEDLVLWAQILLCLAAIGLVLAAGALDWPVYPELRRAFTAAMQPEQSLLLGGGDATSVECTLDVNGLGLFAKPEKLLNERLEMLRQTLGA